MDVGVWKSVGMVFLGSLVLLVMAVDVLWTTLRVGAGGGPLTRWVTTGLWRRLLAVHRRFPKARPLEFGGVGLTLVTLLSWGLMLWAGWALIFLGVERTVVETSSSRPADPWGVVYFVGYTISDLGIGDYRPSGAVWQVLTVLASLSGISLITLSISYLVPIVSAVVEKRAAASHIAALGGTPHEIVLQAREDGGEAFKQHLFTLTPTILALVEKHKAYPVLHYFHSPDRSGAFSVGVAVLDEAMTMLEFGVRDLDLAPNIRRPAREAIGTYLDTLRPELPPRTDQPPPPTPSLEPLERAGAAVTPPADFEHHVASLHERRRRLESQLRHDGYDWRNIFI